jgi:hypothetical protein
MKIQQFIFSFLLVMFLCGFGCSSSKPAPDPLAGWQLDFNHEPDPAIAKDYQDYIQKLSFEEKGHALPIVKYFKDGTGQHAIQITIGFGTDWEYVLNYDKDNKRTKTIKYVSGHSYS